jgi:hypothetical protein
MLAYRIPAGDWAALEWLRANQARAATMEDLASHYKAPYLYAVLGERVVARRYAQLFCNRYLQPDGDFRTCQEFKGWGHLPCSPANRYIYSNGWAIVGFQKMGDTGWRGRARLRPAVSIAQLGGFLLALRHRAGRWCRTSSIAPHVVGGLHCSPAARWRRRCEPASSVAPARRAAVAGPVLFLGWQTSSGLMTDVFGEEDQNALRAASSSA